MELERVEALCDRNSGTCARIWSARGDRRRERGVSVFDVGALGDPSIVERRRSAAARLHGDSRRGGSALWTAVDLVGLDLRRAAVDEQFHAIHEARIAGSQEQSHRRNFFGTPDLSARNL